MHSGGRLGVRLYDGPDIKLVILVDGGLELLVYCFAQEGSTGDFLLLRVNVIRHPEISIIGQLTESVSPRFVIYEAGYHDYLYVHDD